MKTIHSLYLLTLALVTALVSGCGAGASVKDPFVPTRIVVFGDALSDMTSGAQYTVNGGTEVSNWAAQVATSYGITSVVKNAMGNAKVADIATQVAGFSYQSGDLVLINAGMRDLIDDAVAGTNNANAKGLAFADVIRNMVGAGAKHIAVINTYDLAVTPYGRATGKGVGLARAFNDALKADLQNPQKTYISDNVYLIDTELHMNRVNAAATQYSFTDATTVVCTLTDSNLGIGLDINSKLCTTANVGASYTSTYNNYVFADKIYPTPAFHRSFGSYAHALISTRW
jgi:outer membrane lipase/esterase